MEWPDNKNGERRVVTKSERVCAREKLVYDILKEKFPEHYGDVEVSKDKVSIKERKKYELTSICRICVVLRGVQTQLHDNGVLHCDLKPERILEQRDARTQAKLPRPFFTDFESSIIMDERENLQQALGMTAALTSLECIVREQVHELDDYEAVLTSAVMVFLAKKVPQFLLPSFPMECRQNSFKSFAAWKLRLMEQVFVFHRRFPFKPKRSKRNKKPESPRRTLSWVTQMLLLVWTLPRDRKRLSEQQRADLVNPDLVFRLDAHVTEVRQKFASHLGQCASGDDTSLAVSLHTRGSFEEGQEAQEGQDHVQSEDFFGKAIARNKQVNDCPEVTLRETPLLPAKNCLPESGNGKEEPSKVAGQLEHKRGGESEVWAEYKTLLVFDNDLFDQTKAKDETGADDGKAQRGEAEQQQEGGGKGSGRATQPQEGGRVWDYGDDDDWASFRGEFGVKLIDSIGGKYLCCVEATPGKKPHIADFLSLFEPFVLRYSLRPLDVLLLLIGLRIDCHNQPFSPPRFRNMVDNVQHSDWTCAGKECPPPALFKKRGCGDFRCCSECGRAFCSICSPKHEAEHGAEHAENPHKCENKVRKELLPNMSLFVLLLSGRVSFVNRAPRSEAEAAEENPAQIETSWKRGVMEGYQKEKLEAKRDTLKRENFRATLEALLAEAAQLTAECRAITEAATQAMGKTVNGEAHEEERSGEAEKAAGGEVHREGGEGNEKEENTAANTNDEEADGDATRSKNEESAPGGSGAENPEITQLKMMIKELRETKARAQRVANEASKRQQRTNNRT